MAEGKPCQRCGSQRVASCIEKIDGDSGPSITIDGVEQEVDPDDGMLPEDMGISDGDSYLEFRWCLQCGQIQGEWPRPPTALEKGTWPR